MNSTCIRQATAEPEESIAKETTVSETDAGAATWVLAPRKFKETRLVKMFAPIIICE